MTNFKNRVGRPIMTDVASPWAEIFSCAEGQAKLAEKLGVSQSTISRWARGHHRIPTLARKALIEICREHSIKDGIQSLN